MKTAFAIVFVFLASLAVPGQVPAPTPLASATPQQHRILSQPGAPVRIVSANATWVDVSESVLKVAPSYPRGVEIFVVVENVSQQIVRTYATRRGQESTKERNTCLGPPGGVGRGLRPGQRTGTSTWQSDAPSDPAPAIWIDFVELEDGTRWGEDVCGKGDHLDGERSGARAQRDQLMAVFREQGPDGLMTFIRNSLETARKAQERGERPLFPAPPPPGQSQSWQDGYLKGAQRIIQQVIDAERDFGADEIEHVLLRPIEPSEKKPR